MIQIRPFDPAEDYNFVIHTWMTSIHKFSTSRGYGQSNMTDEAYFHHQRPICEGLMQRAKIHIACAEDFPSHIYGFLVEEQSPDLNVIHFAYTKRELRKSGVFKKLLSKLNPENHIYYTHHTRDSDAVATKLKAIFDPIFITVDPNIIRKGPHEKTIVREIP